MTRVSERIYGWLGWCPHALKQVRHQPELCMVPEKESQEAGGGIPEERGCVQHYRNRVLAYAVFFAMISLPLVAIFLTAEYTTLMLCLGIITGMGIFAYFGRWLWHSLGMLAKGLTITTGTREYVLTFLIAGALPLGAIFLLSAMLLYVSLAGALAFPAFATGFVFIPWYVFILILFWERRTGLRVMFDRETGSFTAVEEAS